MSKRENEKAIFRAFLRVAPDFAGEEIADWAQPTDENDFPDIVCKSRTGNCVGIELGEWLNEDQMALVPEQERMRALLLGRLRPAGRVEIAMSGLTSQKKGWVITRKAFDRMLAKLHPDGE